MNQIDQRSGKAGFTLIEIIAVLVILAVLAAVAIPRYIDLMANARQQALQGANVCHRLIRHCGQCDTMQGQIAHCTPR